MKNSNLTSGFLQMASVAFVVFITSAGVANAGSVLGELEYRYPCTYQGQRIDVVYSYRSDAAIAGIQREAPGPTVIVVNEQKSREQSPELVTFEFFAACQLAQKVLFLFQSNRHNEVSNPATMRDLIFRSDCDAIAQLKREGLLYGSKGNSYIMDTFYYELTRERYLDVAYPERANNIQERCPI